MKANGTGTILLVDDDDDCRMTLALLLARRGYDVVTAASGQEALNLLRTLPPPCLILLDLRMPGMDGYEFRAQQSQTRGISEIPVVIISGETAIRDDALGAVAVFTKPVTFRDLRPVIERWCSATGAACVRLTH